MPGRDVLSTLLGPGLRGLLQARNMPMMKQKLAPEKLSGLVNSIQYDKIMFLYNIILIYININNGF